MSPRRYPTDAQGEPLDADKLYTPISSHARDGKVFNAGLVELRGDHPAILALPSLWIRVDASTEAKTAVARAHIVSRLADIPPPPEDHPSEPKIVEPRRIPFERRVIATDTFSKGMEFVRKGAAHDVDDAIVKAAPEMFRDLDGRQVRRTDDVPAAAPLA